MSTETMRIDGRVYVSHDCWTFGDYGGAGSIGKANIQYISEQCEGHVYECGANALQHVSEGCPYGLGADELTEIRADRPWLIIASGSYGSEVAWVRKPIAARLSSHGFRGKTWLERMDSYPVFDDELSSLIEMEWETEAWESWLRSDLIRTLPDDGTQEETDMLPNATVWGCYRAAMDETNTEVVAELSGVHVDVERIADAFADNITAAVSDLYIP